MKVTAVLVQNVEFEGNVDLSKIKTTDDWDELLYEKAIVIDTHIKELKGEEVKCPKCSKELRIIKIDALEKPVLFCQDCRTAYEEEEL